MLAQLHVSSPKKGKGDAAVERLQLLERIKISRGVPLEWTTTTKSACLASTVARAVACLVGVR
jgi:hypothetical protein